jgi:hypothetical protein
MSPHWVNTIQRRGKTPIVGRMDSQPSIDPVLVRLASKILMPPSLYPHLRLCHHLLQR